MKVVWICVGVSVVLHVALAFASPQLIAILKPEIEKKEKKKKKREIVIALIPPTTPETVVIPPAPKPAEKKQAVPTDDRTQPKQAQPQPQPMLAAPPKAEPQPKLPNPEERKKPAVKLAPAHARTSDDQLAGIPEDTNLQGERNTLASSNAEANPNAANQASIQGEKSDIKEATNTSYQDGDLAHMNKGGDAVTPPVPPIPPEKTPDQPELDPKKLADKAVKEAKSSVVESADRGEAFEKKEKKLAIEASVLKDEVKKYLDSSNKTLAEATEASSQAEVKKKSDKPMDAQEAQEKQDTIANKRADENAPKQKAEEEKQRKKASQPKQASSNKSKKGFRSEAKATRFEGSISRRSKAGSRNVKATPLGKYMATVSKQVEREWQRRCSMRADMLQPGTLRMGFILNDKGKILRIYTISQTYGSEMNRSITFQAINSAKLPPMPAAVKSIQNGDPIEFIYTFAF